MNTDEDENVLSYATPIAKKRWPWWVWLLIYAGVVWSIALIDILMAKHLI